MITKPTIIITSLGRTGTKFFQLLFQGLVRDGTSLHEPDYLNFGQYRELNKRIRRVIEQVQESGVSNLMIKKALGKWSLIELSDARMRGRLGYAEAVRRALDQRREFVRSRPGSVYIESSSAYYGLIDVLTEIYERHRVVYIIRDGRDWVRSKMNFGKMYKKGRIRGTVSYTWPTALEIGSDPYQSQWEAMSRFERICWAWAKLNGYALKTVSRNPGARVFRFEDIFNAQGNDQHLAELIRYAVALPGVEAVAGFALDGWLDRQVHTSDGPFPSWEQWSTGQKQRFRTICGPLMAELGYKFE
jgi:hypothetical protein